MAALNFVKTSRTIVRKTVQVATLILIGCSKAADPSPAPTVSLVGTWSELSSQAINCTDPLNNTTAQPCSPHCTVWIFTATQATWGGMLSGPHIGPYTIKGDSLIVNFSGGTGRYKFSIDGSTLNLQVTGGGCTSKTVYQKTS